MVAVYQPGETIYIGKPRQGVRLGGGGGVAALPTANLLARYIGDDITSLTAGSNRLRIDAWPDASGNGNDIVGNTSAPDITAYNVGGTLTRRYGLNGHSGARFAGHYLTIPNTVSIDRRNFTMIWVQVGWRAGRQLVNNGSAGGAYATVDSTPRMLWNNSHKTQFWIGSGLDTSFRAMDQPHIVGLVGTAGALTVHVNDKTATLAALASGTSTTLAMGNATFTHHGNCIYEMVIYGSSSVDTDAIKAYLKQKYAIGATTWTGRVAFAGDSQTYGTALADPVLDCYPQQCLQLLGGGWHGTNSGYPSTQVSAMITDAPTNLDPYIDATNYTKNVCVLLGGTNDLYFGADAATTITRISDFCAARQLAGWKVVVCTILPRSDGSTPGSFEADRQTVNASIRANWATYADAIADIADDARIGEDNDEQNATYYADLVHMTPAGYAIVAGIVKDAILTV